MTSSRPFVVNMLIVWAAATFLVNVTESRQHDGSHHVTFSRSRASDDADADESNGMLSPSTSSLRRARREASDRALADDDQAAAFETEMKRYAGSRPDKLAFRSDLGKRRTGSSAPAAARRYSTFRTDFGKRSPSSSSLKSSSPVVAAATKENWKRYNAFRSDLGKRYSAFRSDLGKRGSNNEDDETEVTATGDDVELNRVDGGLALADEVVDEKRFASFRSDLGKRRGSAASNLGFRSDLGK